HLMGDFECIRCKRRSTVRMQTKLLRHERDNCCRDYGVGDTEQLVGLCEYCPLEPWDGKAPLVVAVGVWDYPRCGLDWQWAGATFDVQPARRYPVGTIRELIGLQPWQAADLAGVHLVEAWLAEHSNLWGPGRQYNWFKGIELWNACPLTERREWVAAG